MNNTIHKIDFIRSLPPTLKHDKDMLILAQVIAKELQTTANETVNNIIYPRIDYLDENILDLLAYDLHVDWYDTKLAVKEKRNIIKSSVKTHKYLGTKYAVRTVLEAIYSNARIEEWFEYNGEPYTFKIKVRVPETISKEECIRKYKEMINKVEMTKNARSHLVGITMLMQPSPAVISIGSYTTIANHIKILPYMPTPIKVKGNVNSYVYTKTGQTILIKGKE